MNRRERRAAAKLSSTVTPAYGPQMQPRLGEILRAEALRRFQAGQLREARHACRRLLADDPNDLVALHISGLLALQSGDNEAAIKALRAAIQANEGVPDLHSALAEALWRLGRTEEAVARYRRALELDPDYLEALYNGANALLKLARHAEALTFYDRALRLQPGFVEAINNRAHALAELGQFAAALAEFQRAVAIRPQFAEAWANRGTLLIELKQIEQGITSCEQALAIDPGNVTALAGRANGLFEARRYAEAAAAYERVLVAAPNFPYAEGRALYCRLLCCDWAGYDDAVATIAAKVEAGERAVIPFMFLNMSDSAEARLCCAQIFSRDKYPAAEPLWRGERYDHAKIRVAYLSADFRNHPMAHLMAGMFERHDRARFETIAISFGPDSQDGVRQRLQGAFDRFIDVQNNDDRTNAVLLRELEIDVAVDLMGYTNNCRPGILALRPAPVQVNFIGFAGTIGAEFLDYIIGDRFIIPESSRSAYAEQVVYLPDTYWPTDPGSAVRATVPGRRTVGLPDTGFVFCCFNQNYKLAPAVFDVWMRLLRRVEGSVLWLVEDNADAARNLRREAERRGVDTDRLVFAPRVPLDEYRARFALADLFLDTLPFNAHTTASDALWEGLPVLTCAGSSFAARVAGSLLHAVGMPELITETLDEYEALALRLASDGDLLAATRAKLAAQKERAPLFDTGRFTRHIEAAYQGMWERCQRGEKPGGFAVTPIDGRRRGTGRLSY